MSKRVEASQEGDWWSAPQAIVWIVTRDETEVAAAAGIRFLPGIERLTLRLRPHAGGDEPPIRSSRAAQAKFLSAIPRRTVEVLGCYSGEGRSMPVSPAGMIEPCLQDRDGGICIVDGVGGHWQIEHYWSDLAIRSGECMRRWPGAPILAAKAKAPHARRAALPTREKVETCYRRRVDDHDPQQPPPSRLDDERAAKKHFGRSGLKDLVRAARNKLAPNPWRESGPKGRKVHARAAATATQPGPK
jgi:hypothetical protein